MCCRSLRVCCVSLMRRVNPSGRVKSTFISVCRCSWIPPALTVFPSQPKMATGTPHPKTRGLRLPSLITPARWVTGSYMLGCAHAEFSVMCSAAVPHFTHKHQCIVRVFRETLLRVNAMSCWERRLLIELGSHVFVSRPYCRWPTTWPARWKGTGMFCHRTSCLLWNVRITFSAAVNSIFMVLYKCSTVT